MDPRGMLRIAARFGVALGGFCTFEVYESLTAATAVLNRIATSQIAMPVASNNLVHATSGHSASARNQAQITLASDMVFSDGASLELAAVTGDVTSGMTAALTVAV